MACFQESVCAVLIGNCGKEALAFVFKGKQGPAGRPFSGIQTSPREECWSCLIIRGLLSFLSSFYISFFLPSFPPSVHSFFISFNFNVHLQHPPKVGEGVLVMCCHFEVRKE